MFSSVLEKYKDDTITVKRTRKMLIRVSKKGGLDAFKGKIKNEDIKDL